MVKITYRWLLRRFCLESTILGLKYFYLYPDWISRCFWAANMVLVLVSACNLSKLLYLRFMETPTRVTIESQNEPLRFLPYPSITICSPNQVTQSFIKHFNRTLVDGDLDIDLYTVVPSLLGFYEITQNVNHTQTTHLQTLLDRNRHIISEVVGALPQSCEDFLKNCVFERVLYPNCKDLFTPILTPQGLCCTFNNQYHYNGRKNTFNPNFVNHTVTYPDISAGLVVLMDHHPDDSVPGTLINAGAVRIIVSDTGTFPYRSESVLIESNTISLHIINGAYTYCSEDVKQLAISNRYCYFEHEKSLRFFDKYHQSDCELECFILAIEKECGCLMFFTPQLNVKSFCDITDIICIKEVNYMSRSFNLNDCDCLPDCEFREYKVDVTIGNMKAIPYTIYNPLPYKNVNDSSSIMSFFFTKPVYTKKKQETVMSLMILFANLGGVFGLCLGCSCISVVEIFFSIYVAIRKRTFMKRRTKKLNRIAARTARVHYTDYVN